MRSAGFLVCSLSLSLVTAAAVQQVNAQQVTKTPAKVSSTAAKTQSPAVMRADDKRLVDAPSEPGDWLMTARDYSETRYSPLKQVDATNAGRLGLDWSFDTESDPGPLEAAPTVYKGRLYVTGTWSVVMAVDAHTGKEVWRYDPHLGRKNFPPGADGNPDSTQPRTGPSLCCGPMNRGVAVYDNKIYAGLLDGRLVALDADTGKVVWSVQTTPPDDDYSITGAPRVVKGKVIIGNGGAEFAARGFVTAYDAKTGKQVWRFYTVPGDPHKPQESKALEMALKTWTGDNWYKWGGGGTAWDAFSYDPELDLLYIGTGNGGPYPLAWRSPGPGNNDNLFLSSIVAVRPDTGEYVWHYQVTPGDEWDYTAVQQMTLADIMIDGQKRKVLMQAPKSGFFYVIDRTNGKFISAMPIAKVTWASSIDPKTGRPVLNPGTRYDETGDKGSWIMPNGGGVHNWHGQSYNPVTGLVYVPGGTSIEWFAVDKNFKYKKGVFNWGQYRNPPVYGQRAKTQPGPQAPEPEGPTQAGGGADNAPMQVNGSFVVAWDPATQQPRWRVMGMNGGGTVTTAGNLVFVGSAQGELVALTADKGEKVWSQKLQPGLSNPSVYMLDGKEYIAVMAGTAGHGRLYTFELDGKGKMPVTAVPAGANTTQNGVYSAAQATRGEALYQQNCAMCHGANLSGNGGTPALTGVTFNATWEAHPVGDLYRIIQTTMPKQSPGSLKAGEYADIVSYLLKSSGAPAGQEELGNTLPALNSIYYTNQAPAAPAR